MASLIVVVRLDREKYGAGPGTVCEVTAEPIEAVFRRYSDRDGARFPGIRFWRSSEAVAVGDRVAMGAP